MNTCQWLQLAFAFLVFLAGPSTRFSSPSSTHTCPSITPACCTVALLLSWRDWVCGIGPRSCCCTFKIQSGKVLLLCKISLKFHSKNRCKSALNRSLFSWLSLLLPIGAIQITNDWTRDKCNLLHARENAVIYVRFIIIFFSFCTSVWLPENGLFRHLPRVVKTNYGFYFRRSTSFVWTKTRGLTKKNGSELYIWQRSQRNREILKIFSLRESVERNKYKEWNKRLNC